MDLLSVIERSWGWTGLRPTAVVGDNPFGNLIVKDQTERYWRICPEDLFCAVVAASRPELDALSRSQEFLHDWYMATLVGQAEQGLGPLRPGYRYCLKIPATLGGQYGGDNLATLPLLELIAASGHIAQQIRELPDGAQVRLVVTE
ncbi:DUF1851 domain-containing protein [Luteimonas yindakuii]|uniref:DUF1851 domain-containing protein n=1 Tax=Luteimonas yindakuii TaxID=2565782 RepID=A0A4Z1RFD0_9GAMM|nr:T6SS immunity protein Tdi1 domain-containing protein [Luteimonas yindakuii]QCO68445.1 DUF1851 domain-containing protein [Luteimonas yindakuii]TKS54873.1 DUF1851 domain-containing protein [Luteimonas yindakuii]